MANCVFFRLACACEAKGQATAGDGRAVPRLTTADVLSDRGAAYRSV